MAWTDVATALETTLSATYAITSQIPANTRMTAVEFAAIRERAVKLREQAMDLVTLADTWHPLSQHEIDKAEVSRITDQKDFTRQITRDSSGREVKIVLASAALNARVEIVTVYDGERFVSRTVTPVASASEVG